MAADHPQTVLGFGPCMEVADLLLESIPRVHLGPRHFLGIVVARRSVYWTLAARLSRSVKWWISSRPGVTWNPAPKSVIRAKSFPTTAFW